MVRKSKHNSKTLKDIYGNMLNEIVKFYLNESNALKLVKKCVSLENIYRSHNIIAAK